MKIVADNILKKMTQELHTSISVCVCACRHRDDTIPHTGLPLSIHSLEVIIFNFCPHWPAGRWLAWIPFLSGHQICPDRNLLGLITKLAAALQTCSFLFLSLGTADWMHWMWTSAKTWALFVIFTLLSFYDHPVNVSTVKSWLNQNVSKKKKRANFSYRIILLS